MEEFQIYMPMDDPDFCAVADLLQDGYPELIPSIYNFDGIFYCHMASPEGLIPHRSIQEHLETGECYPGNLFLQRRGAFHFR